MNKQERDDFERQMDQAERSIKATERLADETARHADAQEIAVILASGDGNIVNAYRAQKAPK